MRYEDTPIGETTEQAKRDMDLIKADVLLNNWDGVIRGVEFQVDSFTSLLANLKKLQAQGRLGKI